MRIKTISLTVHGEAVPKARPKLVVNKYTGKAHMYTADKTRNWEACVLGQALEKRPKNLIEGPIWLRIKLYKRIPKSWSKKKHLEALDGFLLPTGRPDLSNYIKSIEDALNGIYWGDDGQVVGYLDKTGKYYSEEPRVELDVQYWED